MTLKSVFEVRNSSTYPIHALCAMPGAGDDGNGSSNAVLIPPNDVFNVPLSFLHKAAILSNGLSVGVLYVRPTLPEGHVQYKFSPPINLLDVIGTDSLFNYMRCPPKVSQDDENVMNNIPAHNYCLEITRDIPGQDLDKPQHRKLAEKINSKLNGALGNALENRDLIANQTARVKALLMKVRSDRWQNKESGQALPSQILTMSFHPPLVLENLLAGRLVCRIDNPEKSSVFWKGAVEVGASATIYSISSTCTLNMSLSLPDFQCVSTKALRIRKHTGNHSRTVRKLV